MMDDRAFLLHIRDALHEVRQFVEGTGYEGFLEDRMMQNAVMRSFEVVGEAARLVSPEFRDAHPDVPWRLMGDCLSTQFVNRGKKEMGRGCQTPRPDDPLYGARPWPRPVDLLAL